MGWKQLTHGVKQTTHDVEQTTYDVKQTAHGVKQTTHDVEQTTHNVKQTTHGVQPDDTRGRIKQLVGLNKRQTGCRTPTRKAEAYMQGKVCINSGDRTG